MSDKISKNFRQQATLFVLGGLSQDEQNRFELEMNSNKELYNLVEELKGTLDISRVARKKRPSHEFLQGQRNLLRYRIEAHEASAKPARAVMDIFESITEIASRLVSVKQPAWAIATYVMIAFIGGIMVSRSGVSVDQQVNPSSTNDYVYQNIDAGNPVRISNVDDSSVSFTLKDQPQIQLAGNVEKSEVKDMLYYSLLNDQNDGNRMKAVNRIVDFDKDLVTMDVLIHSLLNEPNPGIRLKTVRALKEYEPNSKIVQACTKVLLGDVNDMVRQEALSILSTWNRTDIVPVLQVVSGMDQNENIRNESRKLLYRIQFSKENETIEISQ